MQVWWRLQQQRQLHWQEQPRQQQGQHPSHCQTIRVPARRRKAVLTQKIRWWRKWWRILQNHVSDHVTTSQPILLAQHLHGVPWLRINWHVNLKGRFFIPATDLVTVEEEEEEERERHCDSLIMCIVTTLNEGLRNGGGIGDILRKPSSTVSSDTHISCEHHYPAFDGVSLVHFMKSRLSFQTEVNLWQLSPLCCSLSTGTVICGQGGLWLTLLLHRHHYCAQPHLWCHHWHVCWLEKWETTERGNSEEHLLYMWWVTLCKLPQMSVCLSTANCTYHTDQKENHGFCHQAAKHPTSWVNGWIVKISFCWLVASEPLRESNVTDFCRTVKCSRLGPLFFRQQVRIFWGALQQWAWHVALPLLHSAHQSEGPYRVYGPRELCLHHDQGPWANCILAANGLCMSIQ